MSDPPYEGFRGRKMTVKRYCELHSAGEFFGAIAAVTAGMDAGCAAAVNAAADAGAIAGAAAAVGPAAGRGDDAALKAAFLAGITAGAATVNALKADGSITTECDQL